MLESDYYLNYKGPNLVKAILGTEDITDKMKELYGVNNNWSGCLWMNSEVFGDDCLNKNYRFDFESKDGHNHWFHGFITDKKQYFNPPLVSPVNQNLIQTK